MIRLTSQHLRGRLIGCLVLLGTLGLGGVVLTTLLEGRSTAGAEPFFLREPYQDLLLFVPLGLSAMLLVWLVSGRSLQRLAVASRQADAIGPHSLQVRLSEPGLPREVLPLVGAVNGALDRLAKAYMAEQRFISDAAHQLRTPLTGLSLRLQRAREGKAPDWDGLIADIDALDDLIDRLLRLARHESRHRGDTCARLAVRVDLAVLSRQVASIVAPLAEATGRSIAVECPDAAWVRGHVDALSELMVNLLENAVKHGRGAILLRITVEDGVAPSCRITAIDEGRGIPPELGTGVFDRFTRGDHEAEGHGLGLAIVREIALAHGGAVRLQEGTSQVVVELPLPAPDTARPFS